MTFAQVALLGVGTILHKQQRITGKVSLLQLACQSGLSSKQLHNYIIFLLFIVVLQLSDCYTIGVVTPLLFCLLLNFCTAEEVYTLQARQAEAFRLCHFSLTIRIQPHAQRASALLIIPVTDLHYKSTTDVSELSSKYTDFPQNAFINSAQIYMSICFTK